MSIYAPITFYEDEVEAIEFFEKHRGNGWSRINPLVDYYFNTIQDAGPNWENCEKTVLLLKEIKNAIDDIVEYMVEKYADWGSD